MVVSRIVTSLVMKVMGKIYCVRINGRWICVSLPEKDGKKLPFEAVANCTAM